MKPKSPLRHFLVLAGSSLLSIPFIHATPLYWDGNTTTAGAGNTTALLNRTWGTFAAWNTDPTGGAAGAFQTATLNTDDLYFVAGPSATSGNVGYTVTVSGAQVANSLNFRAPAATTISGGTSITLGDGTAGSGGITMNQFAYGSTAQGAATISTAIILNNSQTWTNNSAQELKWSSLNLGTGTLTFSGTGNFSSIATGNNIAATAGSIIHNGSGLVSLPRTGAGNLAYTGTTTISGGGTLMIDDLKPVGNFNITNGILTDYYQTTQIFSSGLGTGDNQIQITGNSGLGAGNGTSIWRIGGTGSTLVWGASGEGTATGFFNPTTLRLRTTADNNGPSIYGNVTLDNRLDLNSGTRTIDVFRSGASIVLSSARIDDGIQDTGGAGNLIKNGGGMLVIGGTTSTWGGTTTINNGALDLSAGTTMANIGGGSGRDITLASGTGLRFGQTVTNAVLNRLAENSNEIFLTSPGTGAGGSNSNNLDFSSSTGANLPNAFFGGYAGNNSPTVYSGTLTPASDNYRLGASFLGQGVFVMNNNAAMSGSQGLIVGGNIMLIGAKTFTGDTEVRSGFRLGLSAFTGSNVSLSLQNSVLDTTATAGTIWLEAGSSTPITGATTSANGGTTSAVFGGLSGNKNLSAIVNATAGGNNTSATAVTAITGFTLNVGTGQNHTYSGAIGGFGTGASGGLNGTSTLAKTGTGTQILTGVSTYSGATTISNGILAINSSGTINNSDVTINGGNFRYNSSVAYSAARTLTFTSGTLSGTNWGGELSGLTIGSSQTISPGNSPGTATTGSQIWATGGSYEWEINDATGTAGADPGWDLVSGAGTLDITASSGSEFNILVTSLTLANAAGLATNFNDALSFNWLIADFASVTGFAANAFNIDTTDFDNPFTGNFGVSLGGGVLPGDNSQIYLIYTPIPEPRAALLGALGLLMLLRRRR